MKLRYLAGTSIAVFAIGMPSLAATTLGANLVVNGDFENDVGNVIEPSGWTLTPAPTNARAAAVNGIGRDNSRGYFFGSEDAFDQLSQVITTVAGHEYQIDMWIKADNFRNIPSFAIPTANNFFYAQFLPYSFNLTQNLEDSDYFLLSVTRAAFSSATTLVVLGNSQTGNILIDDISVREILPSAAVPEPAAWAMMVMGFGLIGGVARRRNASVRLVA